MLFKHQTTCNATLDRSRVNITSNVFLFELEAFARLCTGVCRISVLLYVNKKCITQTCRLAAAEREEFWVILTSPIGKEIKGIYSENSPN